MGRLLFVVGILMILASIVGSILPFTGFQLNFNPQPDASALCKDGEMLIEETGASVYTPGQGYASPIRFFCQDSSGERYEVTGNFAEGLIGDVSNTVSGVMDMFTSLIIWVFVLIVGIVLMIIGGMMSRGRRYRNMTMPIITSSYPSSPVGGTPTGDSLTMVQTHLDTGSRATSTPRWGTPTIPLSPPNTGDLASRLQQLDGARQAGLISQEEYERLRQRLLDELAGQ